MEATSMATSGPAAKTRYTKLETLRDPVLRRARDQAALTIPGLLPPEGYSRNQELPQPYQSLGARGVNNLVSKILLAVLPPGIPMFRYRIDEDVASEISGEKQSAVEQALAKRERKITTKIETSNTRPVFAEVLRHLVVTGNALLHMPKGRMRMYRIDQYCIQRTPDGDPLEVVVKEVTVVAAIPNATRQACEITGDDDETVEIYTRVVWDYESNKVRHYQEINEKRVPNSEGFRPIAASEWIPLRWTQVPGSDYGRSHVEEHMGDLRSYEGLSEAIVQFAAAASKIVLLVHPNSSTKVAEINAAESGDAIAGTAEDVDYLQMEKYADFQVTDAVAQRLETRLSYAFLLRTGATRDAERVTAEEIRAVAQELEDVLGGVYTVLAQELQLPFVRRLTASMIETRELAPLPPGTAEPVVTTGFEALGRNHSLNRLRAFIADAVSLLQDRALERIDDGEVITRLGTGYGIEKLEDLVLDDDVVAQRRAAAQAGALAEKVAAPVATAALKQNQ